MAVCAVDDDSQEKSDVLNTMIGYSGNYEEFMKHESKLIEDYFLNKIEPEYGNMVDNFNAIMHSDMDKIILYNNLMVEILFAEYKSFFLWRLEQKSKETGRQIKQKEFINEKGLSERFFWLDRGVMDSEECNGGIYKAKNRNRRQLKKELADERNHTCLYPNGFEEYEISIQQHGDTHKIRVSEDNKSESKHFDWDIDVGYTDHGDKSFGDNIRYMNIYEIIYDYDEYYKEQNLYNQDAKDGMWEPVPRKQHGCKRLNKGGMCHLFEIKDMSKWDSSDFGPSYQITGVEISDSMNWGFSKPN